MPGDVKMGDCSARLQPSVECVNLVTLVPCLWITGNLNVVDLVLE